MSFDTENIPPNWKKEHLLKESILCLLSHDGSILLLNYARRANVEDNFVASFRKAWFLEKKDRRSQIRCVWEAKRMGATKDMIRGLMNEWDISEADTQKFGTEIYNFSCLDCTYCVSLDSFGAYSCNVKDAVDVLWVQLRPRKDNTPKFPRLFYPEEMVGACSNFKLSPSLDNN